MGTVPMKKVVNADAGDADHVGGNDWDDLVDYLNNTDKTGPVKINTTTYFRDSKFRWRNPGDTFSYIVVPSAIAADRNITLPLLTAADTFCMTDFAQTLKNKTIDSTNTVSSTASLPATVVTEDTANDFGDFDNSFKDNRVRIWNPADTFRYTVVGGAITSNRNASLPVLTSDDTFLFLGQTQSPQNKTLDSTNTIDTDYWRQRPVLFTEFTSGTNFAPFSETLISSATASNGTAEADHPGIRKATSSTSANSGVLYAASNTAILLGGGEAFECNLKYSSFTNNTVRVGLHDATTSTAPVDGVYIEMSGSSSVSGKTMNNTSVSTTGTSFTASSGVWYRFKITVTSTSRVDFYIYNDAGAQQWTDNLTTNIPSAAGRQVGMTVIGTNSTTTGSIDIYEVDNIFGHFGALGTLTR